LAAENIEDKALEQIKSHANGVLQSDLWKELGIDSRKCSRIISKLEADNKIKRTWETVKGTRTYRISYLAQKKEAPKKAYSFDMIMAEGNVAPCVGCTYECEPDYCPDLGNWIELLAKDEISRAKRAKEEPEIVEEEVEEEIVEEPAPKKIVHEKAAPIKKEAAKKPAPKPAAVHKAEAKKSPAKKSPAKKSKA
jgi:DNA-binding MarR family transcriptional regulator